MKRSRIPALALLAVLLVWTSNSAASGRDSDGSRMQARPHSLGSSDSDRLSPPNDAVDWRYLRLKEAKTVELSVSVTPPEASVDVVMTNAMGKSLYRGKTSGGSLSTSRRLDPGLYYVSVSSSRSVSYTISLK